MAESFKPFLNSKENFEYTQNEKKAFNIPLIQIVYNLLQVPHKFALVRILELFWIFSVPKRGAVNGSLDEQDQQTLTFRGKRHHAACHKVLNVGKEISGVVSNL